VSTNGRQDFDGYYLFYGSEEPDFEPDVELQGNSNLFGTEGKIAGGNFNGDSYGDIVTANIDGHYNGEMHIHFGSEHITSRPLIVIYPVEEYGYVMGAELGAIGDYNGNGVTDFAATRTPAFGYGRVFLLAAPDRWLTVDADLPKNDTSNFTIDISPNPSNNIITIQIVSTARSQYAISLFDISGRILQNLDEKASENGTTAITIPTTQLSNGIYFIKCQQASTKYNATKKVLLLR